MTESPGTRNLPGPVILNGVDPVPRGSFVNLNVFLKYQKYYRVLLALVVGACNATCSAVSHTMKNCPISS